VDCDRCGKQKALPEAPCEHCGALDPRFRKEASTAAFLAAIAVALLAIARFV
jgi:hypothetical protein